MSYNHNKLCTEEVIRRSVEKFGDRFSYSRTEYTGAFDPLTITCPVHGDIVTTFQHHMKGKGCGQCGIESATKGKRDKAAAEFITKAKDLLGDGYDFSECVYGKSNKDKVRIRCVEHGIYEMPAVNVLSGQRCPKCARKSQADFHRHSLSQFVEKAEARHGDRYDYTLVQYVNANTKVKIVCRDHGVFEQTPASHLSNGGCNTCAKFAAAKVKSDAAAQRFMAQVVGQHAGKLSFSRTQYVSAHHRVDVDCLVHGSFKTFPHSLLKGGGCKKCAESGYRPNKPGTLYVLECENLVKIGITNNAVEDRVRRISNSYGKVFNVLKTYTFNDGAIPDSIETTLLHEMKSMYQQPPEKFEGYTEAFISVDVCSLLNRIESLTKEHHSSPASQEA